MAKGEVKAVTPTAPEQGPETHAERCARELKEQEVLLAKAREDSKRYDEEMARRAGKPEGTE